MGREAQTVAERRLAGYADVGRGGLGNMLLPWARCTVWCQLHGARMLAPRWFRVRLGPLWRQERDKRRYDLFFRSSRFHDPLLRYACLLTMRRHTEPSALEIPPQTRGLYLFRGLTGGFAPFVRRHALVRSALLSSLRPELVGARESVPFIAVHVRRGDFTAPSSTELRDGGHNYRIPIDWYVRALRALRVALGGTVRTLLFSDGTDLELAPLLAERETVLYRSPYAIVDLLKMSECSALIASGSTFSMWASFLGRAPAVWYPGQRRELLLEGGHGLLEPEWDGGAFPDVFLKTARARLDCF